MQNIIYDKHGEDLYIFTTEFKNSLTCTVALIDDRKNERDMYIFYLTLIYSCYFHAVFVSVISIKLRPYVFVSFSIILNSHFYSLDLKQYKNNPVCVQTN